MKEQADLKIYDISPLISPKSAVFPGDLSFRRKVSLSFDQGHNLGLSSIESTVHIGAHTDAPNHYHKDGVGIDAVELSTYLGEVQVIEVSLPRGERIKPSHLREKISAKRVLFKTSSFPDPNSWNNDFNSLSKELISYLSNAGVILVGIDTPSVDPADDKVLESHNEIYKNSMAILEGIVLDEVNSGLYTLLALPLKIKDADASPVRAVLLPRGVL